MVQTCTRSKTTPKWYRSTLRKRKKNLKLTRRSRSAFRRKKKRGSVKKRKKPQLPQQRPPKTLRVKHLPRRQEVKKRLPK